METDEQKKLKIFWIYIYGFFLALFYAVISYSGSTFLADIINTENIWILYSTAAVFAIILNLSAGKILRKININKLFITVSILTILNSYLLSLPTTPILICIEFIFYYSVSALLFTFASVILEEYSKDSQTGSIRGRYNAIMSGGYLLAPFIASLFIANFGIKSIFILSSVFGLGGLFVFYMFINKVPRLKLEDSNLRLGVKKLFSNYDLKYITLAQIGLTTFYALAVIYLPFKLETVGISLTQYLSILLPVALTPFLFMPPLLGYLEDKMKDEKEVLIISYIGLILTLVLIAFCNSTSVFVWAILLFVSRLCASSIEISTNSYFYKKIDAKDVSIISIFLSTDYVSTIIFTPILSLLLFVADVDTLFLTVSFFLCFVLVYISKIHDTKNYEKHKNWKEIWHRSKKRAN
jgi:MFS family permease